MKIEISLYYFCKNLKKMTDYLSEHSCAKRGEHAGDGAVQELGSGPVRQGAVHETSLTCKRQPSAE